MDPLEHRMAAPPNQPIPLWLAARLRSAGGDLSPRYEASLYGPINSLLVWYFPVTQQFMIKPQAKIRPEYSYDMVDDGDEDMVRVSLDSYDAEVLPREEEGGESSLKVPDFIAVKATASLHNDRVLFVVEVKRLHMSLQSAKEQLAEYFGALVDKHRFSDGQPLFDHLEGLLVVGNLVTFATLATPGAIVQFSPFHDIAGGAVHTFVRAIAAAHW
jgi:hypothetical protein